MVERLYEEMARETTGQLVAAGADPEMLRARRTVEMRYVGQGFEVEVPVPTGISDREAFAAALLDAFLQKYDQLFGRRIEGVPVETVSWRLKVNGVAPEIKLNFEGRQIVREGALKGERLVHFPEHGYIPTRIYNRYGLTPGTEFRGPAVVEERESTVVAGPDATIRVDEHLNLIIDIEYQRDSEKGARE
jgi:N-methylhydantoinase A